MGQKRLRCLGGYCRYYLDPRTRDRKRVRDPLMYEPTVRPGTAGALAWCSRSQHGKVSRKQGSNRTKKKQHRHPQLASSYGFTDHIEPYYGYSQSRVVPWLHICSP
ncbi:Sterol 24-C-methyltransferase [Fusarium oxysporum f. sp. albedinis]|nr:Sterol 24-C-methyltransferase [Fusarium oxysporum f. sp. albedinis]